MNKVSPSRNPQKANILYNGTPNENKYFFEQQKQIELHNMKMRQIISEIKYNLSQRNNIKNGQKKNDDFILHFSTQDLKDLHAYIHQNGNSLFLTGKYSEARQLILIGEFIDDELEKRGEIKNSKFSSPSRPKSNLVSPIISNYNSPTPSAPPEYSNYSPTRPKSGFLTRKAANKIQKFDDETTEMVKQMQARHEQLRKEYVLIWEKNMQSHYFKPSKTLQELRKRVIAIRKKCIQREEEVKNKNQIYRNDEQNTLNQNKSQLDTSNDTNINENNEQINHEGQEDSNEQTFDDFGDEVLKKLNSHFLNVYQVCQQLEAQESEMAQKQYQNDYSESQRKLEEKQMMELEVFLKERILKRQKLLMNEGVNANAFKSPPGSKSQFASRKISPLNSRKNSPSKIKNVSKMPPLMSYSKMASRNSTTPETPRNQNENADMDAVSNALTKEAIMQLTPNITVSIPSSPALIAIEDKFKHNQEKMNKSSKKSNLNAKNSFSPTFRTEKRTQTPSINDEELEDNADNIESECKPIPFDNINGRKHLPPI